MEIEQAWLIFDQLRSDAKVGLMHDDEDYFCRFCGGKKASGADEYGVSIDLPTCTLCGVVDESYISHEPEWRTGADHEGGDPCRVGAPENLDHFSQAWNMGTLIKKQWSLKRNIGSLLMRQLQSNVNHKDRSLWHAYNEMDRIGTLVLNLRRASCTTPRSSIALLTKMCSRAGRFGMASKQTAFSRRAENTALRVRLRRLQTLLRSPHATLAVHLRCISSRIRRRRCT